MKVEDVLKLQHKLISEQMDGMIESAVTSALRRDSRTNTAYITDIRDYYNEIVNEIKDRGFTIDTDASLDSTTIKFFW